MKRIIGISLVAAALLAGCGGASTGTEGAGTAANTTAVTGADGAVVVPTTETGTGEAGDIVPDATVATNVTAVTGAGATTTDATAQAMPVATATTGDTTGSTTGNTTGAAMTGAYQPADIPELGLTFQVPEGWQQVSGENAWSPAGMDVPRIGVASADLTADWRPSSFLPEGASVKSSEQVTVGGMQAMLYTVENSDGTAETHAIMRSGEKAYDIYARAQSLQELKIIQPALNDIVGSVQLNGA